MQFPPTLLLERLPEIFSNRIPRSVRRFISREDPKPWQLAEEAMFSFFRHHMAIPTQKLGRACLFRHEPEGMVVGLGPERNRALIYECKCRRGAYRMSHDDLLRYESYIFAKRAIARSLHLELTNLVIIVPAATGSYRSKLET